ncbi:MAG: DUF1062 domain-containing protein [Myxococcota bacterium]
MSVPLSVLASLSPVVAVRVTPLEPPRVVRRCPRCDAPRPFGSSGAFRVNAQKRRLDVWLVRRCEACDATWNQPVAERVSPASLGARLVGYQQDDPALVHAVAHDVTALKRHGKVLPAEVAVEPLVAVPPVVARVVLVAPVAVRLDHVLCEALGLSRARLRAEVSAERVIVEAALDRPAADGALAWIGPQPVAAVA